MEPSPAACPQSGDDGQPYASRDAEGGCCWEVCAGDTCLQDRCRSRLVARYHAFLNRQGQAAPAS